MQDNQDPDEFNAYSRDRLISELRRARAELTVLGGQSSSGPHDPTTQRMHGDAPASDNPVLRILERITDGFFALDTEWRFVYVNSQAERLLLRSREELIGHRLLEVYPEAVHSAFEEVYRKVLLEQTPQSLEEYYPPHDMWYELHAYPSQTGLTVYLKDVTARKKAQALLVTTMESLARANAQLVAQKHLIEEEVRKRTEELKETNIRLREQSELMRTERNMVDRLVENLPGALIYIDQASYIRKINPIAERMMGVSAALALGRALGDVLPEEAEQLETQFAEMARTGQTTYTTNKRTIRQGAAGPVETYWDVCRKPLVADGAYTGSLVMATDVTWRVQLEREVARNLEQIERQRRFIERVNDHIPAIVACLDTSFEIRYANSMASDVIGLPLDRIVHRRLPELLPDAGLEAVLQSTLETGEPNAMSGVQLPGIIGFEEDRQYWDIAVYPVRTDDRATSLTLLAIDVSQRVKHERLQKEQIDHLKRVDALKEEFLAVMSHEVRSPLAVIMGSTGLLETEALGPVNPKQQQFLSKIFRSANVLLNLVNNVLASSQIRSGTLVLHRSAFDFGGLVESVGSDLIPLAQMKHVDLELEVEPHLEKFYADEYRIRKVVRNLLDNAVKFSLENQRIDVRVQSTTDGLRFEVEDHGIGIEAADLTRLFQPFSQLDHGTARRARGAGLGLFVSKSLIEAHGGTLGVRSEPGRGSCFWFTLPAAHEGT